MAKPSRADERRRYPRVTLNLLIQYRFDTFEEFFSEYAADLSLGGMLVHADAPRELGSLVYLQFALKDGTKLIEGLGKVVRIQEGERLGLGLEFVNFDEDSRALIESIVAEQ